MKIRKTATRFGRYTVSYIAIAGPDGITHEGLGIARCSDADIYDPDTGNSLATGRAFRAAFARILGEKVKVTKEV